LHDGEFSTVVTRKPGKGDGLFISSVSRSEVVMEEREGPVGTRGPNGGGKISGVRLREWAEESQKANERREKLPVVSKSFFRFQISEWWGREGCSVCVWNQRRRSEGVITRRPESISKE
jgi:hypothetical protein